LALKIGASYVVTNYTIWVGFNDDIKNGHVFKVVRNCHGGYYNIDVDKVLTDGKPFIVHPTWLGLYFDEVKYTKEYIIDLINELESAF
jgi:hypothetical protein